MDLLQHDVEDPKITSITTTEALDALDYFSSSIRKVEQILPKFAPGTSQHTLSTRRIQAFQQAILRIQYFLQTKAPGFRY